MKTPGRSSVWDLAASQYSNVLSPPPPPPPPLPPPPLHSGGMQTWLSHANLSPEAILQSHAGLSVQEKPLNLIPYFHAILFKLAWLCNVRSMFNYSPVFVSCEGPQVHTCCFLFPLSLRLHVSHVRLWFVSCACVVTERLYMMG